MTPEALRRRMAHGNIYAPEMIDAALGNYCGDLLAASQAARRALEVMTVYEREPGDELLSR